MTKIKISLDHIEHNNARRMEFFLNALKDELREIPVDWKEMKMAERMSGVCRFISMDVQTPFTITLYFCNSYFEATEIAKANLLPSSAKEKWSINGDVMFLVETQDPEKLSEILSFFAGKE